MNFGDDKRRYTNSEGWTWLRCRRRWYLSYYRKLEPNRVPWTGPLHIGTRVHKVLEAEYQPGQDASILAVFEQVVAAERDRLVNVGLSEDEMKAYEKEVDLSRAMVEGFNDWRSETGCDADLEVTDVETHVDVASGVEGVNLLGKLDVRGRMKTGNSRLFIDHKTVGSINTYDGTRKRQFLHYHLLELLELMAENPGVPIEQLPLSKGTALNLVRKVKRTANAKPPFYARVYVHHSIVELRIYWEQLHGMLRDILQAEQRLGAGESHHAVAYPTEDSTCSWQCQFYEVCGLMDDGSDYEGYLSRYMRSYDPNERYADDEGQEDSE